MREYLAKAEAFLLAATSELEAERSIAATSLSIHAGITTADADCGARLKKRAAGHDHRETISLLAQAGDDVSARQGLTAFASMKTTAEYEPDDVPLSKASNAVQRAKRCVDLARRVVGPLLIAHATDSSRTPQAHTPDQSAGATGLKNRRSTDRRRP